MVGGELPMPQPGYCRPVHGGDTHRVDDVTSRAEQIDPWHQQRECRVTEVYGPDKVTLARVLSVVSSKVISSPLKPCDWRAFW